MTRGDLGNHDRREEIALKAGGAVGPSQAECTASSPDLPTVKIAEKCSPRIGALHGYNRRSHTVDYDNYLLHPKLMVEVEICQ